MIQFEEGEAFDVVPVFADVDIVIGLSEKKIDIRSASDPDDESCFISY